MKCLLTLFFMVSAHILSFCQSYQGSPKDTIILNQLIDSVNNASSATYTDCKSTIYKAKKLVHKSDNDFYAEILVKEGYIFFEASDFVNAAKIWDSACKIYQRLNSPFGLANCYNKVGLCCIYNTNYSEASEKLFKGITVAEKIKDTSLLAKLFTNVGLLYESLEDVDNALIFAKKTIPLKISLRDSFGLAITYNNIGNLYYSKGLVDSAIANIKIACLLHSKKNNQAGLMGSTSNLGLYFLWQKKYDSAIQYLTQAENISKKINDIPATANLNSMLSDAYFKKSNLLLAGKYAQQSYSLGKNVTDYSVLENIYKVSHQYYKASNNIAKAYEFLELLDVVKDTLHNQSKNLEHQKIAIKYELGKKLVADSLQAEQKVLIANNKTTQTRNSLLILALLLVIALAIAIILYNRSNLFKKKAIIVEQEKQIEAQQKIAYQLKTLQAQMNPHFVFNCFNTIDSFILQNKQYEASLLVQRFSKLSRKILEQTSLNKISFEEEIETLNTYLQIEKLRTNNSFDFSIEKEEAILNYQLPPMLLQPFVENAVVHGVRALQNNNGFIKIKISSNDNFIEINIEDNGVGRNKSSEIKEQNTPTHRSMSMDLTLQRLKALHQNSGIVNYLQFIDFDIDKTGTLVTIKIPKIIAT